MELSWKYWYERWSSYDNILDRRHYSKRIVRLKTSNDNDKLTVKRHARYCLIKPSVLRTPVHSNEELGTGPRHSTSLPLSYSIWRTAPTEEKSLSIWRNVLQGNVFHLKHIQVPITSHRRDFFLFVVAFSCTFTQSFRAFAPTNGVVCLRCAQGIDEGWTQPDIIKADIISQGVVLLAQPSEYNHFLNAAVFVYDLLVGEAAKVSF